MIVSGLPDNFLHHPACLDAFVRVGWARHQEYELDYLQCVDEKLKKRLYSIEESPVGNIPRDCHPLNMSVNTLGMLWYYARISQLLAKSPASVLEFGGGFGSLARVFVRASETPITYVLIDLPEMLALQFYYLSHSLGRDRVAAHIRPDEAVEQNKINLFSVYDIEKLSLSAELFVSTFALSETTEFLQDMVGRAKDFFNAKGIYITGQLEEERKELVWQTPRNIITSSINRLKDVRISRFHIGHNYELIGSNEPRHLSMGTVEETTSESAGSGWECGEKGRIVGVVFSKDRAMQLDCTLRTLHRHCKDIEEASIKVIYTTSNQFHARAYQKLKEEFPSIEFVKERAFRDDLLSRVSSSEYVLFLVDDNIFVRDFRLRDIVGALKQDRAAIGVSLRLGRNTRYCYMLDKAQRLPEFDEAGDAFLAFDWTASEYDFGYPLEVSSSAYRVPDILSLLKSLNFVNPNSLEALLRCEQAHLPAGQASAPLLRDERCFLQSCQQSPEHLHR